MFGCYEVNLNKSCQTPHTASHRSEVLQWLTDHVLHTRWIVKSIYSEPIFQFSEKGFDKLVYVIEDDNIKTHLIGVDDEDPTKKDFLELKAKSFYLVLNTEHFSLTRLSVPITIAYTLINDPEKKDSLCQDKTRVLPFPTGCTTTS